MLFINTGTEAREGATAANAEIVCARLAAVFGIPDHNVIRRPERDDRKGWFGFDLLTRGGKVELDVPGDDPDEVCRGQPTVSRRLYVDGSSWLYGFALDAVRRRIEGGIS